MAAEFIAPMDDQLSTPWRLYHNPHFLSDPGLTSPHPISDLALARAEIISLRTELELERRLRREANSISNSISLQLDEERRLRAEAEAEAERFRDAAYLAVKEAEDERRMLKLADALREERVQMKLADASFLLEERMREIEMNGMPKSGEIECISVGRGRQGRENPQIKRGAKGFVESPRIGGRVRSPRSARGREAVGGSLECQKAQLRAMLRQRNGVDLAVVPDAPSLMV